ncbi:hypothetical protein HOLleu_44709 [Holothuria leucospilota]|uniref:Uncharacterized protein n=1 Tax=Holothuria leucospilota TaxID=206669 RepID=A0A9Q0Y9F7_HOLLE|nr:hypothetical protein HOLleu_44709 [Holothuria leucospilota]
MFNMMSGGINDQLGKKRARGTSKDSRSLFQHLVVGDDAFYIVDGTVSVGEVVEVDRFMQQVKVLPDGATDVISISSAWLCSDPNASGNGEAYTIVQEDKRNVQVPVLDPRTRGGCSTPEKVTMFQASCGISAGDVAEVTDLGMAVGVRRLWKDGNMERAYCEPIGDDGTLLSDVEISLPASKLKSKAISVIRSTSRILSQDRKVAFAKLVDNLQKDANCRFEFRKNSLRRMSRKEIAKVLAKKSRRGSYTAGLFSPSIDLELFGLDYFRNRRHTYSLKQGNLCALDDLFGEGWGMTESEEGFCFVTQVSVSLSRDDFLNFSVLSAFRHGALPSGPGVWRQVAAYVNDELLFPPGNVLLWHLQALITKVEGNHKFLHKYLLDTCITRENVDYPTCASREPIWHWLVQNFPNAYAPKGRGDAEVMAAVQEMCKEAVFGSTFTIMSSCCDLTDTKKARLPLITLSHTCVYNSGGMLERAVKLQFGRFVDSSIAKCSVCGSGRNIANCEMAAAPFLVLELAAVDGKNRQIPGVTISQNINIFGIDCQFTSAILMRPQHFLTVAKVNDRYAVFDDLKEEVVEFPALCAAMTNSQTQSKDYTTSPESEYGIHVLVYKARECLTVPLLDCLQQIKSQTAAVHWTTDQTIHLVSDEETPSPDCDDGSYSFASSGNEIPLGKNSTSIRGKHEAASKMTPVKEPHTKCVSPQDKSASNVTTPPRKQSVKKKLPKNECPNKANPRFFYHVNQSPEQSIKHGASTINMKTSVRKQSTKGADPQGTSPTCDHVKGGSIVNNTVCFGTSVVPFMERNEQIYVKCPEVFEVLGLQKHISKEGYSYVDKHLNNAGFGSDCFIKKGRRRLYVLLDAACHLSKLKGVRWHIKPQTVVEEVRNVLTSPNSVHHCNVESLPGSGNQSAAGKDPQLNITPKNVKKWDNLEENLEYKCSDWLNKFLDSQQTNGGCIFLSGDEMFLEHILDGMNELSPSSLDGWNLYSKVHKNLHGEVAKSGLRTDLPIKVDRLYEENIIPSIPLRNVVPCLLHALARCVEKLLGLVVGDIISNSNIQTGLGRDGGMYREEKITNLENNINLRGVKQGCFSIHFDSRGNVKPIKLNKDHAQVIIAPVQEGIDCDVLHNVLTETKIRNTLKREVSDALELPDNFTEHSLVMVIWSSFYHMINILKLDREPVLKEESMQGSLEPADYKWGYTDRDKIKYKIFSERFYQTFKLKYGARELTPYMMKLVDYGCFFHGHSTLFTRKISCRGR